MVSSRNKASERKSMKCRTGNKWTKKRKQNEREATNQFD